MRYPLASPVRDSTECNRHHFVRAVGGIAVLLLGAALAGCVSTRQYRLAASDTPPPAPLNLSAAQPPAEGVLHAVVIYKGPGSWKREAYWDEYIVSFVNRGDTPLTIESAVLLDLRGEPVAPGTDPWALEHASREWLKKNPSTPGGIPVQFGFHPVLKSGAYAFAGATSAFGWFLATAGEVSAIPAGGVVVLAWPAYALSAVAINHHNKNLVAEEFSRRRLALPLVIAPGQRGQGSLFFRVSPGPQRLIVHGSADGRVQELALDLAPLAGLHLQPAAAASASVTPPQP